MSGGNEAGEPMRRVQIGLAGLAAVLLLVGVADMALDRAGVKAGGALSGNTAAPPETPNEPLVDLGVSPAPADAGPSAAPPPGNGAAPGPG